jgi:hypothetical protein
MEYIAWRLGQEACSMGNGKYGIEHEACRMGYTIVEHTVWIISIESFFFITTSLANGLVLEVENEY